jgi:polysaccharide deacetylase 2 family uncharacterized protein YibQ
VRSFFLLFFPLVLIIFTQDATAKNSQIAIIIDDIGYRQSDAAALTLPGKITYAILPHTPFGKTLAQQAFKDNRDVILHIPMEAENGKKLGPGALTSAMSEQAIRQELSRAFEEIPFALGINNHMGSKLTKLYKPMVWTMRFLKERNLIFIDSVTTGRTKAERIAYKLGVPTTHRQFFLDNELNSEYIDRQFMLLIEYAQQHKSVVAIAHPHPESITALNRLIPLLAQLEIDLVPISTLVSQQANIQEVSSTHEE